MADPTTDQTIEQLRQKIDILDSALLSLIERRQRAARAIVAKKQADGRDALDPERESEIINRLYAQGERPYLIREIWRLLFSDAKQEHVNSHLRPFTNVTIKANGRDDDPDDD